MYEIVRRPNRKTGVMEDGARERAVPEWYGAHDAKILRDVRKVAHYYDTGFSIGPIPLGLDSALGWIPGIGDFIGLFMAMSVFFMCRRVEVGLGAWHGFLMICNILIDSLLGIIPFVGDLFDMGFKANTKNVRRLEKRLERKYAGAGSDFEKRRVDVHHSGDRRLPYNRSDYEDRPSQPPRPAPAYHAEDRHQTNSSRRGMPQRGASQASKPLPRQPDNGPQREDRYNARNYLNWGRKQRSADPEMGEMSEMQRGPRVVAARA